MILSPPRTLHRQPQPRSSATPHPHAICGSCLGVHVAGLVSEHKIGEEARILCVVPDCDAFYSEVFLKRAVAPAVMDKRGELERNWNLEKMERSGAFQHGNEKLARCPVCAYPMVVPKDLKIFQCPSEECREESCLECGKPSHIPMTCEEANTETLSEKVSRRIAEAMTKAVVRNCPECSMPLLKDGGCNKMHCKKCDVFSCYLCSAQLSTSVKGLKRTSQKYKTMVKKAYSHFCQVFDCDHSSCGTCPLYDKSGMDADKMKSRIAGEEEVKKTEAFLVNECGKSVAEARSIIAPIAQKLFEGLPAAPAERSAFMDKPLTQFEHGGAGAAARRKNKKRKTKKRKAKHVTFANRAQIEADFGPLRTAAGGAAGVFSRVGVDCDFWCSGERTRSWAKVGTHHWKPEKEEKIETHSCAEESAETGGRGLRKQENEEEPSRRCG